MQFVFHNFYFATFFHTFLFDCTFSLFYLTNTRVELANLKAAPGRLPAKCCWISRAGEIAYQRTHVSATPTSTWKDFISWSFHNFPKALFNYYNFNGL